MVQVCANTVMLPIVWICPECRTIYRDHAAQCERDALPLAEVKAHQSKARYPLLDKVIDARYHLIGGLGQGGLGTVYLAQHLHLDQLVAVKFLDLETVGLNVNRDQKKEYQTDFMKEARVASLIRHDSVVRVSDFGEFERLPYLVMDYVPGPSLLAMITERGRFTVAEATKIARKIAGALDAFHERQLVHRDLKPANVILDPRGEGLLTLVDLGLVKDISGPAGRASTHPMALRGTPGYLAPEQVPKWVLSGAGIQLPGDKQLVDTRVDMYALGVIFYEMLAGLSPYPDGSNTQIIVYACTRAPLPLSNVDPPIDLTPGLEQLIYDTMSRDPAQRPQTAGEFIERLDRLKDQGESSAAWPVMHTTVGRAAKPKQIKSRHRMSTNVDEDLRMETQLFHSMDEDRTEAVDLEDDTGLFDPPLDTQYDTAYDATMEVGDDSFDGLLDNSALDRSSQSGSFGSDRDFMTRVDTRSEGPVQGQPTRRATEDPEDLEQFSRRRSPVPLLERRSHDIAVAQTLDPPNESRVFYWIGLVMITIATIGVVWFLQTRPTQQAITPNGAKTAQRTVPKPLAPDAATLPKAIVSPTQVKDTESTPVAEGSKAAIGQGPTKPLAKSKPAPRERQAKATAVPDKTQRPTRKRAVRDQRPPDTQADRSAERAPPRSRPRISRGQSLEALQQTGDAALSKRDYAKAVKYYEKWLKKAKKSHPMYFTIQDRIAVCKDRL
jgi:serine/threonine protein kinase